MVFDLNGYNITHNSIAAKDYVVFEVRSGAELHVVDTKGGSRVQSSATPHLRLVTIVEREKASNLCNFPEIYKKSQIKLI